MREIQRLASYIRNHSWFNNPNKKEALTIAKKLYEHCSWDLRNYREIPVILEKLKKDSSLLESIRSHLEYAEERLQQFREQEAKHEAEIIRLKDIIQAKQVQIDKLLESK